MTTALDQRLSLSSPPKRSMSALESSSLSSHLPAQSGRVSLGFPLSYEDVEYLLLAKPNLGKSGMRLETFRSTEWRGMAVFLDRDKHMLHMELNRWARLSSVRYYQSTMHATPLVTALYGYSAESMQRGLPYTTTIELQRGAGKGKSELSLNWSGLSPHEGALPDLTIKIKPSYERIDLTELLKLLSKL